MRCGHAPQGYKFHNLVVLCVQDYKIMNLVALCVVLIGRTASRFYPTCYLPSKPHPEVYSRLRVLLQARGLSSAMSAASSACDHVRDWVLGTAEGSWVSMGVYSDGSYGQPEGLIYSFPVTCKDGKWSIVQVRRVVAAESG